MYHWGEGVGRDLVAALGLYLHAFAHGDVRAAHRLGHAHAQHDLEVLTAAVGT